MIDRAQRRADIISELTLLCDTNAVERRIELRREVLQLVDPDLWPALWAELHRELGRDLLQRGRRDPSWNPQEALAELSLAATVFTKDAYSADWARARAIEGDVELLNAQNREQPEAADRAIGCYRSALEVVSSSEQPRDYASILCNLGEAYRKRRSGDPVANLEFALGYLNSAARVFCALGQRQDEAIARVNMASAQTERALGDRAMNISAARSEAFEVVKLTSPEADPDTWGQAHLVIGKTYQEDLASEDFRANRCQALDHFSAALTVFSKSTRPLKWVAAHTGIALTYSDLRDTEKAIKHLRTALRALSRERFPETWASTHRLLGYQHRDKTPADAERAAYHFSKALEVFDAISHPAERRATLSALAGLHFEKGLWTRASRMMAEVLELSKELFSSLFTEAARSEEVSATASLYGNAAYSLLRLGRSAEALLCLEEGKMRMARNRLAFTAAIAELAPGDMPNALLVAWLEFRDAEDNLRHAEFAPVAACGRLSKAREALDQQVAALRAIRPEFMSARLTIEDVLKLVPPTGALVLPFVTSQGSAAFVVPDGCRSIEKHNVVRLDDFTVEEVRDLLAGRGKVTGWLNGYFALRKGGSVGKWQSTVDNTTSRLWKMFIRPIYDRLTSLGVKSGAPVILLPQGRLALLPLHLAWRPEHGQRRYFLDDYTISYAPSISALLFATQRKEQMAPGLPHLLAVIDPTNDLPFVNAEGNAVVRSLPRDAVCQLIGPAATRAAVLQEAARYDHLHFACHGTFHWSNVELSSLRLADGELTLDQLTGLQNPIAARLVTLSGCDTGVAQVFRRVQGNVFTEAADENIGLPLCFLQAGIPAVVGTQWPIDDYAASLVIRSFYARLFGTKDGVAQALRIAQCTVRELGQREVRALLQEEQDFWQKESQGRTLRLSEQQLQNKVAARLAEMKKSRGNERPFSHPDLWGAFIAVGAA